MIVPVCLADILVRRAAFFLGETIPWDDMLWEAVGLCRWLRMNSMPDGDRNAGRSLRRDLSGWTKQNHVAFATVGADVVDLERTPGYSADERRKALMVPRATLEDFVLGRYDPVRTLYRLDCFTPRVRQSKEMTVGGNTGKHLLAADQIALHIQSQTHVILYFRQSQYRPSLRIARSLDSGQSGIQ